MQWLGGLMIEGVTIDDWDDRNFEQSMQALYELSYKYDQADLHRWQPPETKRAVLALAEAGIRDAARAVAKMLAAVFDEWLEQHALLEPHKWAKRNCEDLYDTIDTRKPEEWHDQMLHMYAALAFNIEHGKARTTPIDIAKMYRAKFDRAIAEAGPKMKSLDGATRSIREDIHEMHMEDYEAGMLDTEPEPLEPADVFEVYDPKDLMNAIDPDHLEGFITDILALVVFPVWLEWWRSQGIVETRARILKAWKALEDIARNPKRYEILDLIRRINLLINTAHQTGSMGQYIDGAYQESFVWSDHAQDLLDRLSTMDTHYMDAELRDLGMTGEIDSSVVARRRCRADASDIVMDAWRDLAKEQHQNPRQRVSPLQRAVMRQL